jgi:peptidoglycan LD-endopeptidase LytH
MTSRERGACILVMLLVCVVTLQADPAGADTKDDLSRARERLAAAQVAANAAAARYEIALTAQARLEEQMAQTQSQIDESASRAAALQKTVRGIAVRAYMGASEPVVGTAFFAGDDLLDLGRTARLLDRANAPNVRAIDELAGVRRDLEHDRARMAGAKKEAARLVATLDVETKRVQDELVVADRSRRDAEARFTQEQQLRLLAATSTTALRASKPATAPTAPTTPKAPPKPAANSNATSKPSSPSAPSPTPTAKIVCPVRGAVSFVDSWGAPRPGGRTHQGVDMMAAEGTPNVAVVSGTVIQKQGALMGNGIFLNGDDGNSYWYFHLSRYEGPPRRVAQGELIGYTGSTGNADGGAPHTHFEFHPGGGAPVNPYPLVRAVC